MRFAGKKRSLAQHFGLSVTDMAAATKRPDKLLGMHFHNPAPVMALLELVRTIMTSEETIEIVKSWGATLGKQSSSLRMWRVIVTRLFTPFLLGASGCSKSNRFER